MRGVIVGKGDADHEDDRQYGEHEDAQYRECKKRFVKILVKQRSQILAVGRQAFAALQPKLRLPVLTDIDAPEINQGEDGNQRQQAVEQNEKAVSP